MRLLDSLPERPLTDAELASLNHADSLDLAVDVTEESDTTADDVEGLLLATDDWVKGVAYDGGWRVVATERLATVERFEAMQRCEDAVRTALDDG